MDIFVSYAKEDRERIRPLCRALESRGWSVFWDRRIPAGSTWSHYIGKELDSARCVVVAWSRASVVSDWVLEEADRGKKRSVLLPISLDAIDPPLGFGRIHAADLTNWTAGSTDEVFEKLVEDIGSMVAVRAGAAREPASDALTPQPELALHQQESDGDDSSQGPMVQVWAVVAAVVFAGFFTLLAAAMSPLIMRLFR